MEQFSLDKWLQDKSRKVITRDGREVALFGTLSGSKLYPVKGMIEKNSTICTWTETGISYCNDEPHSCDLFFADKKEELTEFESKLADLFVCNHPMDIESAESIARRESKTLFDLARKELGKQDILKNLPKWKKHPEVTFFSTGIVGEYLYYKDKYIKVEDLYTKLPEE